jgi:hypothetical protein
MRSRQILEVVVAGMKSVAKKDGRSLAFVPSESSASSREFVEWLYWTRRAA